MIDLSPNLREYLISEFRVVATHMVSESDVLTKAYYFSAVPSAVARVLNIEFSESLAFLQHILGTTYGAINLRINKTLQGQERPIEISPEFLDRLSQLISDLADRLEQNKDFHDLLISISLVGYATTGNGFYLYKTGRLTI